MITLHINNYMTRTTTFQDLLNKLTEASHTNRDKGTKFERLIANYLMTDPQYADRLADV